MAISQVYGGWPTLVVGTELVLNTTTPETTAGVYQLFIDTLDMAIGDTVEIRIKEKVLATTQTAVVFFASLLHNQGIDNRVWASPSLILMNGWDMTLKQTTGVGCDIAWSIRKVG